MNHAALNKKDIQKKKMINKKLRSLVYGLLAIAGFAAVIAVFAIIDNIFLPEIPGDTDVRVLRIERGATAATIADSLLAKGLIDNKKAFMTWLKLLKKDRDLKAGHFEIPVGLTEAQLVQFLSRARSKEITVRLLEGWGTEQIARQLADKLDIDADAFTRLASDTSVLRRLGVKSNTSEGYLLPDTYHLYWGMKEIDLLQFLVRKTQNIFNDSVRARMDSLKLTVHDVLTMASIVEGEAILDDERPVIASVYYNRLRRRIKLQADPTIQYIIPGPPRRVLYSDLEIDSPYNTYKYYGLPPGPINNPGKKSILAAFYPAETNYLYFVANGDGGHTFSRTAAEHARAKAKFNKIRRDVLRRKRMQKQRDSQ